MTNPDPWADINGDGLLAEFGPDGMRRWYCPRDLLGWPEERLVPETTSLVETTQRILAELCPTITTT